MYFEYALDPELAAFFCTDAVAYHACKNSFGIKTQRIISRYPDHWRKLYFEAFQKLFPSPSFQQQRARDELFDHLLKRHVKRKAPYVATESWCDNVKRAGLAFYFILVRCNPSNHSGLTSISSSAELFEKLPEHDGHCKVRRRAEDMTAVLRPLLLAARHIIFIDPYFTASSARFIETYKSLLDIVASQKEKSLVTVELHTGIEREFKKPKTFRDEQSEKKCAADIVGDVERFRKRLIPEGINFRIVVWQELKPCEDQKKCEELHNRYIFTDIGGVMLGHGFDEEMWDRESTDDFVCMNSEKNYIARWDDYLGPKPAFEKLQDKRFA
jgi:hypothetical protein